MKPMIVTPYYKEDRAVLEHCIASVQAQTERADHLLVSDGHSQDWIDSMPVRHIRLDRAHRDYGNTPRVVGALLGISEGYDGIGFLDADNWIEPDHVATCQQSVRLFPDADYLIARWALRRPDRTRLPLPDDLFPDHVDTNCFFFRPGSFHVISHFSVMPQELSVVGDKIFYLAAKAAGLVPAKLPHPTVNYTCLWPSLYHLAGETPPPGAKPDIDASFIGPWLEQKTPHEREIIARRCGVRLVVPTATA